MVDALAMLGTRLRSQASSPVAHSICELSIWRLLLECKSCRLWGLRKSSRLKPRGGQLIFGSQDASQPVRAHLPGRCVYLLIVKGSIWRVLFDLNHHELMKEYLRPCSLNTGLHFLLPARVGADKGSMRRGHRAPHKVSEQHFVLVGDLQ